MEDELESKFDDLLNTVHSGEVSECHCSNCKPHVKRPDRTWEGNITAGDWCAKTAIANLGATWQHEPLDAESIGEGTEGACNGERVIWVRPNALFPPKVVAHELGHMELGHNTYLGTETAWEYMHFFEMEAESVAMLVAAALGLDKAVPVSRNYVRSFWKKLIPPKSKVRIKAAARRILAAGRVNGGDDPVVGKRGDRAGDHSPATAVVGGEPGA